MTFTINCQSHKPKTYDIKIESPFGIIKLNNTCKASNKYLQLPEYFGKHSYFERSDPLQALLKIHNITNISIWNDSKTDFVKLKSLKLPSHLLDLKEIPMQNFLLEFINRSMLTMSKGVQAGLLLLSFRLHRFFA